MRNLLFFILFFFPLIIFADVPPEGVIMQAQSWEYLPNSCPILEQEQRSIAVAPNTIWSDDPFATWIAFSSGFYDDDSEVYSKYYHSEYFFWDGPYAVSEVEFGATRPAICTTDNGWIHCVYHGDHDATGTYEIGYSNHPGTDFTSWQWQEIISTNNGQGLWPTIIADGNDLWVAYKSLEVEPYQQFYLQHGIWNGDDENPQWTWWAEDDIKLIAEETQLSFVASIFPDTLGNIHMAYTKDETDLVYRIYDPIQQSFSEEETLDICPEGGLLNSASLVVDSIGQSHLTYSYSYYYGDSAGYLGTTNYLHGRSDNWRDVEYLQYNNGIVDSFCTYPIVGIDNNDGIWVTYSWFQNFATEGEFADVILKYKPADGEWWDGINYTESFDEIPSYPSLTHRVPDTGANIIFTVQEFPHYWSTFMVECLNVPTSTSQIDNEALTSPPNLELRLQNYPNPFNPTMTISYQLPQTDNVTLSMYNSSGQLLKTLIDEKQEAGYHSVEWNAKDVASGVYFYRIEANSGFEETRKCVILK